MQEPATISELRLENVEVGASAIITHRIAAGDLDAFAELTGDFSPLHMDAEFARERGFRDRVAHGVLLAGYLSQLFGVYLPGRNCLLQSISLKWSIAACVGDHLRFCAKVTQVSLAARAMTAEVTVENLETGETIAHGKVQAGFTGQSPCMTSI